jgi:LacI family transcriptional regulator
MSQQPLRANKRRSVTIRQVAERAGVSVMTVSRVLNNRESVRGETRARVEEAIRTLRYRPSLLARGLAGGRSLHIGLIYENPSHGYLSEFLVGALNRCRIDRHHLVIEELSTGEEEKLDRAVVAERLLAAGLEAVIIPPPLSDNQEVVAALEDLEIPFARVINCAETGRGFEVTIDDVAAAREMTEHLIRAGHTRIGFIKGAPSHFAAERRLQGFRAAIAAHGLEAPESAVAQGHFTYRSGMDAAARLLAAARRPTAIFASNDDMAAGAMSTALRLGLRVPDDLSVVGFDDTEIARTIWPQLTTVRQPIADMASTAVELLSRHSEGEQGAQTYKAVRLDTEIIERGTVAPPRKSASSVKRGSESGA